ncbi:MAG: DUF4411 family protein [Ignavibacteria bacterium]|nr:DUF4411 family protein [Ignavibacteria bacterium]
MDLFSQGNTVYVADTSCLIKLDVSFKKSNLVYAAVWEEVEELIIQDCFKTLDFVELEINDYGGKEDFLIKWVKKWRKRLIVDTDVASFSIAQQIINAEYETGFLNKRKLAEGREEADPFLIGHCKVHGCTLITNESKLKSNKIPAVAKKYGVTCIDIDGFFGERCLRMERGKN